MARPVAKTYQEQLGRIKDTVRQSYDYYKHNYDSFNEFRRFVFESSLKEEEITLLATLSKPQLEFNVLEAYVSRLLGEFSKQEPSIAVSAEDQSQADPRMIDLVEAHMRHILFDSKNHHTRYEVYKDMLSGGFSVVKVRTDYANPMAGHQDILFERAYDPTLCGFDPLARFSHKGDGRYCFELFPMSKKLFMEEHPNISVGDMNFRRDFAGFNWSYLNDSEEMLIVADFYEKKRKKVKIVTLRDGTTKTLKEYEEARATYQGNQAFPAIIGKPRETEIESIIRYRCIENQVIEYEDTDYTFLPLVFFDGNSIMIKTPKNGNVRQVTRPYVHQAKGAQRLKNFAGIAWANEIENTVQHKFKVSKESLPKEDDFLQAYKDVQKASVLVYNEFFEQNPDMRLTPPQEIARVGMPDEIAQAFIGSDNLIQQILGSYDAQLGINDNQLSGTAIVEAATQSNSAAMPYIVGFLQGLQRVAELILNLIPKYYTTPRTIPIVDNEGKRNYVRINQNGRTNDLYYGENVLNVKVEAGASFQIQKSKALNQIIALCQASPLFAEFINTNGLKTLLDNIEIRGIDEIKQAAEQFMQQMQQQKQAQMQQQQNDPQRLRVQLEAQKLKFEMAKAAKQFELDQQDQKNDQLKMISEQIIAQDELEVEKLKAHAEIYNAEHERGLAHHDQAHRHIKETVELHHLITEPREPKGGKK